MEMIRFSILAICIPTILAYVSCFRNGKDKKYILTSIFVVDMFSVLALLTTWLAFRTSITKYELLFIDAAFAILSAFILVPFYKNKSLSHVQLLKASCIFVMALVVYTNLTYGQATLHGDGATASLLTRA